MTVLADVDTVQLKTEQSAKQESKNLMQTYHTPYSIKLIDAPPVAVRSAAMYNSSGRDRSI